MLYSTGILQHPKKSEVYATAAAWKISILQTEWQQRASYSDLIQVRTGSSLLPLCFHTKLAWLQTLSHESGAPRHREGPTSLSLASPIRTWCVMRFRPYKTGSRMSRNSVDCSTTWAGSTNRSELQNVHQQNPVRGVTDKTCIAGA